MPSKFSDDRSTLAPSSSERSSSTPISEFIAGNFRGVSAGVAPCRQFWAVAALMP